ncbi:MAG: hypothetical protein RL088_1716 [Verrucomicrobiota bacterium]|jgi:predicted regulator of Ras-like GTPase activity (Roadblock/LC7/MglB family)
MFNFLKKLFTKNGEHAGKTAVRTKVAETPASRHPEAHSGVAVASLSLRAILDRFPADLKEQVNQMPASDVKVVLPVAAIMKQLPSGTVRMSLASLYRQAPSGTFRKEQAEDKRMVDVPLAEVFKTVNPTILKRRDDQRSYEVPDDAVGLFDDQNSRHVANPQDVAAPAPAPKPAAPLPSPLAAARQPEPPVQPAAQERKLKMPGIAPVPASQPPAPAPAPASSAQEKLNLSGELSLLLVEVAAGWQESFRNELSVLPGDSRILIPASEVGPLLQKGRVAFSWEQIRRWLTPPPTGVLNIPDDTQFTLPLKIVAPAFVAATGARKRAAQADTSLPDFFGPAAGRAPAAAAAMPASQEPAPVARPAAEVAPQPAVLAQEAPAVVAAPALVPAALSVAAKSDPMNLRELFAMPDKTDWAPNELVKLTCALPGVAGVVVALGEGLVVTQRLPEGYSADTFAAFMPQIFGRMDQYAGEMQLGATNCVTLDTDHGTVRFFRNGKLFFAALGKSGESLPAGLHLVCNELAAQNQ